MIRPEDIPWIEGDMGALAEHASRMAAGGARVKQAGLDVDNSWHGLQWCYDTPEAGQLTGAMGEFRFRAGRMGDNVDSWAQAFRTFAHEAERMQRRFDHLRAEAHALQAAIDKFQPPPQPGVAMAGGTAGGVESVTSEPWRIEPCTTGESNWRMDPELAERERRLDSDVAHASEEWHHIRTTCAQTLDAAYGTGTTGMMLSAASAVFPGVGLFSAYNTPAPAAPSVPAAGTSPQVVAGWWRSLSDQQRHALITNQSGAIGNLDGVPAWARDQANRNRLPGEYKRLTAELAQAQRDYDNADNSVERRNASVKVDRLTAKVASLTAINTVLAKGSRQLLVLDTSGKRAKTAVANGDTDTAQHVATFTPGFDSTVDGDGLNNYDDNMKNIRQAAIRQSQQFGDGGEVATVTWIGYEPPQSSEIGDFTQRSTLNDDQARLGAPELASFYEGINASRAEDPHLTAMGHSYGSLTNGIALQHPNTGVDDFVAFGSPGFNTDELADLHVPDGHTYVLEASKDPIADVGGSIAGFGADPSKMDGAHNLATDQHVDANGRPLKQSHWHSSGGETGYLSEQTTSQYNMANVIAGTPQYVIDAPPPDKHTYVPN